MNLKQLKRIIAAHIYIFLVVKQVNPFDRDEIRAEIVLVSEAIKLKRLN